MHAYTGTYIHTCDARTYAGVLTAEEMQSGFIKHVPNLDEHVIQYLCNHFDLDGGTQFNNS